MLCTAAASVHSDHLTGLTTWSRGGAKMTWTSYLQLSSTLDEDKLAFTTPPSLTTCECQ